MVTEIRRKKGPAAAAGLRQRRLLRITLAEAGAGVATFPSSRFYAKQKFMKKPISAKQKLRGRPATGITPMMGFRADPVTRAAIVRWAENQPDMPSLSEAIRQLVELGLT